MHRVLITGGAGFIGSHLAGRLLGRGLAVHVLDNLDPFYDPALKRRNLEAVGAVGGARFTFAEGDIRDPAACRAAVAGCDVVVHLAALAGVRPSIQDPVRYMDVNVTGTQVLLQAITDPAVRVVFGSSSSVYGGRTEVPFRESDPIDRPVSPYAASKRAGELQCWTWHHLHGNPVTCLRFFTVYGPRQRPEMAIHRFTRDIVAGRPLPFFGDGSSERDYTYVDDIVTGVEAACARARGYGIYNLGGSAVTSLRDLVRGLEQALGRAAVLDRQPDQPGDVPRTFADTTRAATELGYRSATPVAEGLQRFCAWYLAERAAGSIA
ncbi:MAG: SDR family NAD(P)-dependent oxidoreductase [Planctomycetota bacterium]